MTDHGFMKLHNYLLPLGRAAEIKEDRWTIYQEGPRHEPIWHASITISGATFAGADPNKQRAKDHASTQALSYLKSLSSQ